MLDTLSENRGPTHAFYYEENEPPRGLWGYRMRVEELSVETMRVRIGNTELWGSVLRATPFNKLTLVLWSWASPKMEDNVIAKSSSFDFL